MTYIIPTVWVHHQFLCATILTCRVWSIACGTQTEPDSGGMCRQSLLQRRTQPQEHRLRYTALSSQIEWTRYGGVFPLHWVFIQYLMETQWGQTSDSGTKDTSGPKKWVCHSGVFTIRAISLVIALFPGLLPSCWDNTCSWAQGLLEWVLAPSAHLGQQSFPDHKRRGSPFEL